MKKTVIVVAGGTGKRMGAGIPKQFIVLNDKPVLMHSIKHFYDYDKNINIIVVIPEQETETWLSLVKKYSFSIKHTIVKGGSTRFQSVKNGLAMVTEHCLVAIHDGVRPLCTTKLIKRCFEEAEKKSNAIPTVRITETIREISEDKNFTIDREKLRIVQTPQCFDSTLLKKAYQNIDTVDTRYENFTDDAGVFENDGNQIHLAEGERNNIKITIPEDLIIAEAIEKQLFKKTN